MNELINSLGKDGLKAAYSLIQSFALYLTIAVAIILLVAYLIVSHKAKEKLASFKTLALGIIVGYAVTLSIIIIFLMIARMDLKAELDTNYFLLLGFFLVLVAYALSTIVCSFLSKKAFKIANLIGLGLCAVYGVVLAIVLPTVSEEFEPLSNAGLYGFSALLIAVIALLAIFLGKDNNPATKTKTIAYAGVLISLSFALSFIKVPVPVNYNGGSFTFASLLPLMLFSYLFGARKGLLAGVVYGVLQFLQSPQMYQGMQVLLDYPIAFGAIGLAGIFKNAKFTNNHFLKFLLGAIIAVVLRYVSHVLSGYYVFSTAWCWEGYGAFAYSVVYNLYCFIDLAILLVPALAMFSSKTFIRELEKHM